MLESVRHGWYSLAPHCEVEFEHGVPVRIACEWSRKPEHEASLVDDIHALCGFRVSIGAWSGDGSPEREAPLTVAAAEFDGVLTRRARSAAATFFDRYGHALRPQDTDFEEEAYAQDFIAAMRHCGVGWDDVDKEAHFAAWRRTLHAEAERLVARDGEVQEEP